MSVPRLDEGPFACRSDSDCTNGYRCDQTSQVCVSTGPGNPTCTSLACANPCNNRSLGCQTSNNTTGVCAQVNFGDGTSGLACVACPQACPASCLEAAGDNKPVNQATTCNTSGRCTDLGCSCTSSYDCGPTLVCRNNSCTDPCIPWPCASHDLVCVASQSTADAHCQIDCTSPYASCFITATEGWTCDPSSTTCKSTNSQRLQVLSVHPAPGSTALNNVTVRVTFNMPLSQGSVNDSTFYVDTGSGRVAGQRSFPNDSAIEFVPAGGMFDKGVTYQLHVVAGLKCGAGMPLDRDTVTSFSTY